MDSLSYNYNAGTNQLNNIKDNVAANTFSIDIDNQSNNNYRYDSIGNLIKDSLEGISSIEWTVYGKISKVTKTNGTVITYTYDAAGNRISKKVTGTGASETWYVRDASGNVMATYNMATSGGVTYATWSEADIYGSSRVATYNPKFNMLDGRPPLVNIPKIGDIAYYYNFNRGLKLFELTNHLGNVLATVTDTKIPVNNGNTISYYTANLVNATEYAPFGMRMRGRDSTLQTYNTAYKYGFNGKEQDKSITSQDYDYGMRIYDARVGRFLSIDPLTKKYPFYTPYQFAGNSPVKFIDIDGLEPGNNPKDPANQNGRNPTETIKTIYKESGGDESFEQNFIKYMQGTYDANATVSGISNKPGYTSDSKSGADVGNLWVNSRGVFKASDYKEYNTREFSNFLLGSMIRGVGPENIEFPVNGAISNLMKNSGIVNEAMQSWYILNKGKKSLVSGTAEFSGNKYMLNAFVSKGMFDPESFIGSATVTIAPVNSKEVMVKVFNVTSLTSGDFFKLLPWNDVPISVVRDSKQTNNSSVNKYGNISQTYQFTMPIDPSLLTNK